METLVADLIERAVKASLLAFCGMASNSAVNLPLCWEKVEFFHLVLLV
ncbi:MAG: hypothetical protein V9G98_22690 [Candidatus Competibacter sp.]